MFRRAPSFDANAAPTSIATADFDGDGMLDLIVTNTDLGTVSILIGNGNGTFQPPVSYSAYTPGSDPESVVVADFNLDGAMDVAVANNVTTGTASVLLGNGDGTLQEALVYVMGRNPVALSVGDFDADGFIDIAAGNADGIAVIINAADWPPLPITTGSRIGLSPESSLHNEIATISAAYREGTTDQIRQPVAEEPVTVKSFLKPSDRIIRALGTPGDQLADDMIMNWNF
jgi:hypothetical protein